MDVFATRRFDNEYLRASPALMGQVRHKVDFVTRLYDQGHSLARNLETVSGLRSARGMRFLEIDVAGALRIVATQSGERLVLLRFGPKRIVPHFVENYKDEEVSAEIAAAVEIPHAFRRPRGKAGASKLERISAEHRPSWAWFLDGPQSEVADSLTASLEERLVGDARAPLVHLLLGAAGTGKTCVMLNAWMRLSGAAGLTAESWDVALTLRPRVRSAVEGHGCPPIRDPAHSDLTLIDDPDTLEDIARAVEEAHANAIPLVLALDPLQYVETFDIVGPTSDLQAEEHWLSTCYRQKTKVARCASEIVSSTEAVARHSRRRVDLNRWEKRATKIKYSNPSGITSQVRAHGLSDIRGSTAHQELTLVLRTVLGRSVSGVSPLLVAVDDQVLSTQTIPMDQVKRFVASALEAERIASPVEYVHLSASLDVRGLEYALVVLFVGANKRARTLDKGGISPRKQIGHVRTVTTRARDALCVVEVGGAVSTGRRRPDRSRLR